MSIVIIIPSLSHGGAERVASLLANNWASRCGLDVHLFTFTQLPDFYALSPSVKRVNVPVNAKPGIWSLIALAWQLRRYVRAHRIDAALSFMDKYNVFTLVSLLGTGLWVTVSDRSNPKRKLPRALKLLKRLTYPRANRVIAQTEAARCQIARLTRTRHIDVVPNPVTIPIPCSRSEPEKLVLAVGRLIPEKGQAHLIAAFAKARMRGWHLAILGEGPLRPSLERQIEFLGLADRVELAGVREDVSTWYGRASIFALPSISEGFPNALLEAMAHGLPCIAFDCDVGPNEIITNEIDGFLVPVGDEQTMARRLEDLAHDPALRDSMGRAARDGSEAYRLETISRRYLRACGVDTAYEPAASCA